MDPVDAVIALGGYASRSSLSREGVTRHQLARAHREGRLVRVQRGVYGVGLPEGNAGLRAAAAITGGVISHDAAATLWGLEMVHRPTVVVTVPRNSSRRAAGAVRVVRADLEVTDVRGGLRLTDVLRTVIDCARSLPLRMPS